MCVGGGRGVCVGVCVCGEEGGCVWVGVCVWGGGKRGNKREESTVKPLNTLQTQIFSLFIVT